MIDASAGDLWTGDGYKFSVWITGNQYSSVKSEIIPLGRLN
jgi:hypothetical protein